MICMRYDLEYGDTGLFGNVSLEIVHIMYEYKFRKTKQFHLTCTASYRQ